GSRSALLTQESPAFGVCVGMTWMNTLRLFPSGFALCAVSCGATPPAPNAASDCPKATEAQPRDGTVLRLDLEAADDAWVLRGAARVSGEAHTGTSSISLRHSEGEFAMTRYALDVRQVRGRRLHVSAW